MTRATMIARVDQRVRPGRKAARDDGQRKGSKHVPAARPPAMNARQKVLTGPLAEIELKTKAYADARGAAQRSAWSR
jgi:hypothetical protein